MATNSTPPPIRTKRFWLAAGIALIPLGLGIIYFGLNQDGMSSDEESIFGLGLAILTAGTFITTYFLQRLSQ